MKYLIWIYICHNKNLLDCYQIYFSVFNWRLKNDSISGELNVSWRARFNNIEEASKKLIRMFRYFLLRIREAKLPTSKNMFLNTFQTRQERDPFHLTGSYLLIKMYSICVQPSTLCNHSPSLFSIFLLYDTKTIKIELQQRVATTVLWIFIETPDWKLNYKCWKSEEKVSPFTTS